MANRFIREPREGGDNNVWAEYLLEHTRSIIGILTSRLYNSSGILKLKTGRIGIDNNTNKGIVVIDTEIAISIAGLSANNWIKIEMTVSGTVPTFTATDITGETDSGLLPSIIQNSYDGEKGGYYISNNKRCIGIAYLDAGGAIDYILNFKYNEQKKYERLFARVHNSGAQSEDYVYGRIQDMFSVVGNNPNLINSFTDDGFSFLSKFSLNFFIFIPKSKKIFTLYL